MLTCSNRFYVLIVIIIQCSIPQPNLSTNRNNNTHWGVQLSDTSNNTILLKEKVIQTQHEFLVKAGYFLHILVSESHCIEAK